MHATTFKKKHPLLWWLFLVVCVCVGNLWSITVFASKPPSPTLLLVEFQSEGQALPLKHSGLPLFQRALQRSHRGQVRLFSDEVTLRKQQQQAFINRKGQVKQEVQRLLAQAQQIYFQQKFTEVLALLAQAQKQLDALAPYVLLPRLVTEVALLRGRIHLARSETTQARDFFLQALHYSPKMKLSTERYPPQMVQAFEEARQVRLQSPGKVDIRTNPPGATVYLNERSWDKTPLSVANLPSGRYALRLSMAGYLPWYGWQEIRGSSQSPRNISLLSEHPPTLPAKEPLSSSQAETFLAPWLQTSGTVVLAGIVGTKGNERFLAGFYKRTPKGSESSKPLVRWVGFLLSSIPETRRPQAFQWAANYLLTGEADYEKKLAGISAVSTSIKLSPVPPPEKASVLQSKPLLWSAVGIGALFVGTGIGLLVWGETAIRDVRGVTIQQEAQQRSMEATSTLWLKRGFAGGGLVIGSFLMIGGIVQLVYVYSTPPPSKQTQPLPSTWPKTNLFGHTPYHLP